MTAPPRVYFGASMKTATIASGSWSLSLGYGHTVSTLSDFQSGSLRVEHGAVIGWRHERTHLSEVTVRDLPHLVFLRETLTETT